MGNQTVVPVNGQRSTVGPYAVNTQLRADGTVNPNSTIIAPTVNVDQGTTLRNSTYGVNNQSEISRISGVQNSNTGFFNTQNQTPKSTKIREYINVQKLSVGQNYSMLNNAKTNPYSNNGIKSLRMPGQQIKTHANLKDQTTYTLKNLQTIMGRKLQTTYPVGQGQIYNIRQFNATYQGPFQKGAPHGRGVAHFYDGGYYTGDFSYGEAEGQGVYVYPNGSVYEGQFRDSRFNGQGTLVYVDKRLRYDGGFVNGYPEGQGRQTYQQGDIYQGGFRQGLKSGYGQYTWRSGLKYKGNWQSGLMNGKGVLLNGVNVIFQGNWVKGMKSGRGVFRTLDGTYQGNFDNDYLNGEGTFFYNDGKLYRGNFYKTMMHGDGTMFYPNGQVAEGYWQKNHNKMLENLQHNPQNVEKVIRQNRAKHDAGLRLQQSFYRQPSMNVQGTGTNLRPVDSYGGSMRNSNSYGGTNVVQPIVSTNTYASNVAPYNQSQPFINTNTNIQNTSYVQPQGSMNSGIQNTSYNQPQVVNTNSYSSDQNAAPYSQPRSIVI